MSRPRVGSSTFQLAEPVVDVSGSMNGYFGELNAAMIDLAAVLADAANRGGFYLGSVAYADTARVVLAPKPATDVRPEELAVKADMLGSSTDMAAGLRVALAAIEAHAATPGNWARPVVLLMTDGNPNDATSAEQAATALKAKADLVCLAFGAGAHLALLRRLANTPEHAFQATTGADLRRFFAQVGRTMSQAARTGQNTAALLGGASVLRG